MLRQRLAYTVMSLFVVWHTLAMVIAPAPNSYVSRSISTLLQPYLTLLRLNSHWDFFAPYVGEGSRFRYVIQDKDGQRHTFNPTEGLNWFHPNFFWVRARYYAIMDYPDLYADDAAEQFCKLHAALQPFAVTLLELQEERFTREDFLRGKHRDDPEFFTVKTIKRVRCRK